MNAPIQYQPADLTKLNRLAVERAFTLDEIPWQLGVDHTKTWGPLDMTPAPYLPSWHRLTHDEQTRYGQLWGLGYAEQCIWFENIISRPEFSKAMDSLDMPADLREAGDHLVDEEQKHVEMFWRLLHIAEPGLYPTREKLFVRRSRLEERVISFALRNLDWMVVWVLLLILFEERTLASSQAYMRLRKQGTIDPLFAEVHAFHLRDEVRHFQLDQHLLFWKYDPAPRWQKRLAAWLFHLFVQKFVTPRRAIVRHLAFLGSEFPRLIEEGILDQLIAELPSLTHNADYQAAVFGHTAIPRSLRMIAERDELSSFWKLMVRETREDNLESC